MKATVLVCIPLLNDICVNWALYSLLLLYYRYQQMLHRNLVYLATLADSNQNLQALLPVSTMKTAYTVMAIDLQLNQYNQSMNPWQCCKTCGRESTGSMGWLEECLRSWLLTTCLKLLTLACMPILNLIVKISRHLPTDSSF
jgi:hypothetical protein